MSAAAMKTTPVRTKELQELLAGFDVAAPAGVRVSDLSLDSRAVTRGAAFIALPGARTHGLHFTPQVIAAGARVIAYEPVPGLAPEFPDGVIAIAVPDLTRKLGVIADRFFDAPSRDVRVIGVTGTNGKTTTAHVIAAALQRLGVPSAYAGTLGFGRVGALQTSAYTTPDCITVHRHIAELRDVGVRCLGMEVSSHALDQHRVAGVRFHSAVFTNLTRDHLDYHGTLEAYGEAKARLFTWPDLQHAVINVDDAFGRTLVTRAQAVRLTAYSRVSSTSRPVNGELVYASRVSAGPHGLEIEFGGDLDMGLLHSRFIGEFNVENLLAALATLVGAGVSLEDAVRALEQCTAPPGRMETLTAPGKPLAVVDYAHTPDALDKALTALRGHCRGVLTCVFGCGGERDPGKRPLMAAIAERLADRVIVTDDNPRGEDGDRIVADIIAGLKSPARAVIERDRATAISRAIDDSQAGDAVLIAGKGHEDYQVIGAERRRFSDRETALAALGRRA